MLMTNPLRVHVFLWPGLLALVSLAGLVLALVFDDAHERLAMAGIAIPVWVALYFTGRSYVQRR